MALNSTTLSTQSQKVFVNTSPNFAAVTAMYFCNNSDNTATFDLHLVPSGGTSSVANIIYSVFPVSGRDTYVIQDKILLESGESIQAVCSANNSIVVTISSLAT